MFAASEGVAPLTEVVTTGLEPALTLAWLIPVVPALSAGLLLVFGKRLGRLAAPVAITAMGFAATASTLVFATLLARPEARVVVSTVAPWIEAGPLRVDWAMLLDPLSSVMLLLVTWVGLLIHVYSVGYMHGDERYPRFFAYLNLFAASMLVLVTGSSLLTLFVGWELVGLCSYLLVGFWFERRAYATAAKKAFVVNRIGDVGFMIAMFVAFGAFGALDFATILPAAGTVASATLVAIVLLLFVAATGKSAQIPLYVWLPDAMAGPTPVSALIHAATMVTAGVYLVARTSPLWAQVPEWGLLVAGVGVATALVAAIIACAQNDLKKILAYSTVSQLGYMFVGVGVGDQVAGVFHLLTHGFFKALLFLAAGSVMHAMANNTDVWKMGGLARAMPVTFVTSPSPSWRSPASRSPRASTRRRRCSLRRRHPRSRGDLGHRHGRRRADRLLHDPLARADVPGAAALDVDDHRGDAPGDGPRHAPRVAAVDDAAARRARRRLHRRRRHQPRPRGRLPARLARAERPDLRRRDAVRRGGARRRFVTVAGLLGIALARCLYARRWTRPAPTTGLSGAAQRAFDVDTFYEATVMRPGRLLANFFAAFDRTVVDGAVNGSPGGRQASRRSRGDCRPASCAATRSPCWRGPSSSAVLFGTVPVVGCR